VTSRRWVCAALVGSIFSAALFAQAEQGPPSDTIFRAASDIVLVPASVTDERGRFVSNLTRDDFLLKEDGAPRPIAQFTAERVPISVGMVVDASGSMTGERFLASRVALKQFATSLEAGDELFLQTFSDRSVLVLPWTMNPLEIDAALDRVKPSGVTALFRSVYDAYSVLRQGRNVRKALVVLSDGNDNETSGGGTTPAGIPVRSASGDRAMIQRLQRAVQQAQRSNTVLYAVAIGSRDKDSRDEAIDVGKLQLLTDPTGGYAEVVSSPVEVPRAIARIGEDLRAQYLIGFHPTNADGKTHKISLTTRDKDDRVRARSAYVAAR
jgi:Ca-activated chloride channel homolog